MLANKRALTLLENLISLVIVILIVTIIGKVFFWGREMLIFNRPKLTAAELARYYLSPLQMQVRQDQWDTNCLGTRNGSLCGAPPAFPDPELQPGVVGLIMYTPVYTISEVPGTTLRKVKVKVSWNEPE